MADDEFWRLIGLIDTRLLDSGNDRAAVRKLTTWLSGRSEKELVEFEEALAQKLYAIDGEAYAQAENLKPGHCESRIPAQGGFPKTPLQPCYSE